jgi:hypothetical protein
MVPGKGFVPAGIDQTNGPASWIAVNGDGAMSRSVGVPGGGLGSPTEIRTARGLEKS